jgi:hypothetical protein
MRTIGVTARASDGAGCLKRRVAQANERPVSLNASVDPSFGNVGTTFPTVGSLQFKVNDYMSLLGEAGVLPLAPFREAGAIAPPAGFADTDRARVNAYRWNGKSTHSPRTSRQWRVPSWRTRSLRVARSTRRRAQPDPGRGRSA